MSSRRELRKKFREMFKPILKSEEFSEALCKDESWIHKALISAIIKRGEEIKQELDEVDEKLACDEVCNIIIRTYVNHGVSATDMYITSGYVPLD